MFRSPAKPLKNADWARSNDNFKKTQRNILKLYLFTYSVQNFHSIPFYRERADVLSFRAENVKSKHFRSRAHDSSIIEPFQWETLKLFLVIVCCLVCFIIFFQPRLTGLPSVSFQALGLTERTRTINSWRLALQLLSCLLIVKAIKSKTKRKAKFLNLRKTFVKRKVFPRALVLSIAIQRLVGICNSKKP